MIINASRNPARLDIVRAQYLLIFESGARLGPGTQKKGANLSAAWQKSPVASSLQ